MRKAIRRDAIEHELRRRICAGLHAAGSRIPSRRVLQREFDVSPMTLQLALDRLIDEGFLVARGSRGTFVAEHTPNASRYAVVFPVAEADGEWNRFWATIVRLAKGWRDRSGRSFAPYFIAGGTPTAEGHAQLCADVAEQRIAGAFFVSGPGYLERSPLFALPLPRVIIGDDPGDIARFGASHVMVGPMHGVPDARICRQFVAEGRRRLAVLVTSGLSDQWPRFQPIAQRAGLETRRSWWAGFPTQRIAAASCQPYVRLLFDRPPTERPDALFIGDDNLVPHATGVLAEMGLAIPREVAVIAHANLPSPTRSAVPCRRFGLDVTRMLAVVLDELDRLRAGGQPRTVAVEQLLDVAS